MSKLLFWIVIILAALVVARIAARNAGNRGARPPAAPPKPKRQTKEQAAQVMVRCAHCGIHLPTSEAVRRGGWNYCGLAHSLKGPKP